MNTANILLKNFPLSRQEFKQQYKYLKNKRDLRCHADTFVPYYLHMSTERQKDAKLRYFAIVISP